MNKQYTFEEKTTTVLAILGGILFFLFLQRGCIPFLSKETTTNNEDKVEIAVEKEPSIIPTTIPTTPKETLPKKDKTKQLNRKIKDAETKNEQLAEKNKKPEKRA